MGLPAPALKALSLRRARPFQQFGQAADVCTDNGKLGCTQTGAQFLALNATGRFYTHDEVSRLSGYPCGGGSGNRGMYPSELQRFFTNAKLPYVVKAGLTVPAVLAAAALGPVGFAHSYSRWPQWYGYVYYGRKATGKLNGFAVPLGKAGATQLTGISRNASIPVSPTNPDGHFGVLLGSGVGSTGFQVYAWEPNHNSAARPEDPAYDILTGPQFTKLYDSYRVVLGRTAIAAIPTRSIL